MHKFYSAALLLASVLVIAGCQKTGTQTAQQEDEQQRAVATVLCGLCGHEKGSDQCCRDDCEKCETCGLHAGSMLCCKVSEDLRGKDMCMKCGHVAGSEECCKDDCEICEQCGMHAGSPLCCKLTDTAEADEAEGDAMEGDDTEG